MFANFEEGYLLSETRNDAKSDDESDGDSIMPQIIHEEEVDAMDSGDESEDEPMPPEMLENL